MPHNLVENNEQMDQFKTTVQEVKIAPPSRCFKRLLHTSDTLVSLFVISPLVVTHWQGTWALLDLYNAHFPPFNSCLFGCMLHTSFVLIKDLLHKEFATSSLTANRSKKATLIQSLAMRIYTYIFSIACNMHWWGCWAAFEAIFGHELWTALIPTLICLTILTLLKSLRNLSAPPTFIIMDSNDVIFSFPTRFRVKVRRIGHLRNMFLLL